jgi:AcrR family transcriptional regulator
MKKKTEAKKQAIIQAATEIFQELGFERTSMSKICAKVGGSKATIYNYFASKEDLFFEIVTLSNEEKFQYVHEVLENVNDDIETTLCEFGQRLMSFLYSDELINLRFLAITESRRSNLGKLAYENGAMRSQGMMALYLENLMTQKKIKKEVPSIATRHLSSLLESEFIYEFLFQINSPITQEEIKQRVKRAVVVFLSAYKL